jgi:endonuclease III
VPAPPRARLTDVVATLERRYGRPTAPDVTDPWEQIVLENASYLVDDARRREVFETLRREVGLAPAALLAAPRRKLVAAIERGGMRPGMRADKLLDAARIASHVGAPLSDIVRRPFDAARPVLERFPGIGDPGAEKLALIAGTLPVLALESNGLRALVRLGFGEERSNYAQTWREVRACVDREAPRDAAWCVAAHLLLRRHGQETCLRTSPRCDDCPLAPVCPSA